jgi:hypothetical protein
MWLSCKEHPYVILREIIVTAVGKNDFPSEMVGISGPAVVNIWS